MTKNQLKTILNKFGGKKIVDNNSTVWIELPEKITDGDKQILVIENDNQIFKGRLDNKTNHMFALPISFEDVLFIMSVLKGN